MREYESAYSYYCNLKWPALAGYIYGIGLYEYFWVEIKVEG